MCPHFFNIFLFLQRFDTQGHHMVCRESSKIEGLVKLLGEVGQPEGSWLFIKELQHEVTYVFKVTYLYIQLN